MTREEQIELASGKFVYMQSRPACCRSSFEKGIEWADANRWVRIEDADLSKDIEPVYMFDGFQRLTGYYLAHENVFYSFKNHSEFLPTHISLLPEPPKAEQ